MSLENNSLITAVRKAGLRLRGQCDGVACRYYGRARSSLGARASLSTSVAPAAAASTDAARQVDALVAEVIGCMDAHLLINAGRRSRRVEATVAEGFREQLT